MSRLMRKYFDCARAVWKAFRRGELVRVLRIRMPVERHVDLVLLGKGREAFGHGHLSRSGDDVRPQGFRLFEGMVEIVVGQGVAVIHG